MLEYAGPRARGGLLLRILMRTSGALAHGLVAVILLALAAAGLRYGWLGLTKPPPVSAWAGTGAAGVVAGAVLIIGLFMWLVLAAGAIVWGWRSLCRAWRVLVA